MLNSKKLNFLNQLREEKIDFFSKRLLANAKILEIGGGTGK